MSNVPIVHVYELIAGSKFCSRPSSAAIVLVFVNVPDGQPGFPYHPERHIQGHNVMPTKAIC